MHVAFCPSRQVIEVANIFCALRAHQGNNQLLRKVFSLFLLPHCYSQRMLVLCLVKSSLFDLAS